MDQLQLDEGRKRSMSVSMNDADRARIDAVAQEEGRSRSDALRRAVAFYVDEKEYEVEYVAHGQGGPSDQGALAKSLDASSDGFATTPAETPGTPGVPAESDTPQGARADVGRTPPSDETGFSQDSPGEPGDEGTGAPAVAPKRKGY